MRKENHFSPILFALILIIGVWIGATLVPQHGTNKFDLILNQLETLYIDSINKDELIEKTIETLIKELDPHSSYIRAEDLNAVNEPMEGSFEGIGIEFTIKEDTLLVIAPISGGPSERLGIKSGDKIISVNDEIIVGPKLNNQKVFDLLRGKRGTKVSIGVLRARKKKLLEFKITRDKIPINSLDVSYMVDHELGYVKINRFSATTYQEFKNASKKLLNAGMTKMLLDLRNNPGGYLGAAINVANEFLDENCLIVYTEGRNRPRENYYSTSNGMLLSTEVIILIDEGSASASEIVAGAVQDHDRGVIAGRRSFGKGMVQEQFEHFDGSALRITTQNYYTPSGRCIQKPYKKGLKEEYDNDFLTRFERGELVSEDSIHFEDSLMFKTKNGNVVYGGGGIMPDIFIPLDTALYNNKLNLINRKDLIRSCAFEYTNIHRESLEAQELEYFIRFFQINQKIMNELINKCREHNIQLDLNEWSVDDRKILETQLKAFIARNIWNDDGFYPIINQIDNTFQETIML